MIPVFGLILTLPAFICGIIAMQKVSANLEVAGRGLAITAIILSVVQPIILIALIFFGLLKGFWFIILFCFWPYLPDANLTGTKAMASATMPLEP